MTTLREIKQRRSNNPQGLYWMKSRSGIDMQVRAEEIVLAEPVNGEGMCVVFLQSYDADHKILVAGSIQSLYDRPVLVGAGGKDQN